MDDTETTAAADAADEVIRLRSSGLEWVDTGGEIVVLDTGSGEYLALNTSASPLWDRLSRGATRQELVDALLARFDVDTTMAAADVDELVGRLRTLGLLDS